jgi:hypothetical protein
VPDNPKQLQKFGGETCSEMAEIERRIKIKQPEDGKEGVGNREKNSLYLVNNQTKKEVLKLWPKINAG